MFIRFQGAKTQSGRIQTAFRSFLKSDCGAATVDWASATVVAAGIGISMLGTMQEGAGEVTQDFK